jgi:hypothetical protein
MNHQKKTLLPMQSGTMSTNALAARPNGMAS